jgi:hypothetical protein
MDHAGVDQMNQGIIVYAHQGEYRAITRITHETICASAQASEAIQAAVDATDDAGGQVFIEQGRYPIAQPIRLRSRVKLSGAGRSTRLQVSAPQGGILCEGLEGVEVTDLALIAEPGSNAQVGLIMDGCGSCRAVDLFAGDFNGYGIWVRNHAFLCEVRGCSLGGNRLAGLFFQNHRRGKYGDFIPNLITNCMVYGGGKGYDIDETTVLNVIACVAYQTRGVAFHVHNWSCSVVISGCRTFQIDGNAVEVDLAHEFNLSSNILCWHTGHGVVVQNTGWGTICGNEIIDSGSYNPGTKDFTMRQADLPPNIPYYDGIRLESARGFTLSGNTIFNWPQARKLRVGICEDAECRQNNITGNSINYFTEAGIISHGTGTLVSSNLLEADQPHAGKIHQEMIQSFQPELTDRFLGRELTNLTEAA